MIARVKVAVEGMRLPMSWALRLVTGSIVLLLLLAMVEMPAAQAHEGATRSSAIKPGGRIAVWSSTDPVDCLDPYRTPEDSSLAIASAVADTLVSIDDHGHLKPDLATKWKYSKGGTVLTISLRHGVRFS